MNNYQRAALAISSLLFSSVLMSCLKVDRLATKILYPFEKVNSRIKDTSPPDYASSFKLSDGGFAWYYSPPKPDHLVVYLHGNGESVHSLKKFGLLDWFKHENWAFVVIDYPGLGIGPKLDPTEETLVNHALQALEFAEEVTHTNVAIHLIGRSLGAAVALQAITKTYTSISTLTLVSPWTTLRDIVMLKWIGRFVSEKFYKVNKYDSLTACKEIKIPTFVPHGTLDKAIPMKFGLKVSQCIEGSNFYPVNDIGHNDIYTNGQVLTKIRDMIENFSRSSN